MHTHTHARTHVRAHTQQQQPPPPHTQSRVPCRDSIRVYIVWHLLSYNLIMTYLSRKIISDTQNIKLKETKIVIILPWSPK